MSNAQSPRLTDVGYIRDLLDRHGFHFSKKLGQNFLINPSVCPRMAEACGAAEDTGVLEIGPGIGVLTRELALRAERVVSIELDDRLPPVLAETLAGQDNVSFVWGDCMKLDLPAIIAEKRKMYKGVSPNVDFYSGLIYRMLDLPGELFTPIFAVARIAGWAAHRIEEIQNAGKIIRPAYISVKDDREYIPMGERLIE